MALPLGLLEWETPDSLACDLFAREAPFGCITEYEELTHELGVREYLDGEDAAGGRFPCVSLQARRSEDRPNLISEFPALSHRPPESP